MVPVPTDALALRMCCGYVIGIAGEGWLKTAWEQPVLFLHILASLKSFQNKNKKFVVFFLRAR